MPLQILQHFKAKIDQKCQILVGVAAVERQAVAALEALTVKLSERTFKPLFLRFVEWARASLPAGALFRNTSFGQIFCRDMPGKAAYEKVAVLADPSHVRCERPTLPAHLQLPCSIGSEGS